MGKKSHRQVADQLMIPQVIAQTSSISVLCIFNSTFWIPVTSRNRLEDNWKQTGDSCRDSGQQGKTKLGGAWTSPSGTSSVSFFEHPTIASSRHEDPCP